VQRQPVQRFEGSAAPHCEHASIAFAGREPPTSLPLVAAPASLPEASPFATGSSPILLLLASHQTGALSSSRRLRSQRCVASRGSLQREDGLVSSQHECACNTRAGAWHVQAATVAALAAQRRRRWAAPAAGTAGQRLRAAQFPGTATVCLRSQTAARAALATEPHRAPAAACPLPHPRSRSTGTT